MELDYLKEISLTKEIPELKDIRVCEPCLDKSNVFIGGRADMAHQMNGFPMIIVGVNDFVITGHRKIFFFSFSWIPITF